MVLAAVVDPLKLHDIHHLSLATSLMPLKNEETFPDLSYAPLKDFLGESDGLRIGVGGYMFRLWFSPAAIPISIYKANSLYGSRWMVYLNPSWPLCLHTNLIGISYPLSSPRSCNPRSRICDAFYVNPICFPSLSHSRLLTDHSLESFMLSCVMGNYLYLMS